MPKTIDFNNVDKSGGIKMIEGSDEMRAKKCLDEIQKILVAFDCTMAPMIVLGPQGVQRAAVNVVPISRQPVVSPGGPTNAKNMLGGGIKNGG
ncbi:MAG: hypothetical protein GY938_25755 [Ketobacter sp.]|nr:hypothetical protein [Ketobacter sp.]